MGACWRVGVPDSEKNIFPTPMLLHTFSKEVVRQVPRSHVRFFSPRTLSPTVDGYRCIAGASATDDGRTHEVMKLSFLGGAPKYNGC